MNAFVPAQKRQELQVGWAQVLMSAEHKPEPIPVSWEYLTVHVGTDEAQMGQTVRCVQSETELPKVHVGMEILEALRSLGSQHWELVAVVQAASRVSTHMYVFKRPITSRRHRHLTVLDEEGEDRA